MIGLTYKDNLWNYFKQNYPDYIPNFTNADGLEQFFTDGFDLLTSYNADTYIPTNTTAIITGPNYTKASLQTLSNYIVYNTNINQSTIPIPPSNIKPPVNVLVEFEVLKKCTAWLVCVATSPVKANFQELSVKVEVPGF